MTFARLHRGEMLALAAALCLLLAMSLTWYSTEIGQTAHKIESQAQATKGFAGDFDANLRADARLVYQSQDRSAWQPASGADWVGLVLLCAASGTAIAAAFVRADGRGERLPVDPTAVATAVGAFAAVFLMARIIERPLSEPGATVEIGAYLGLVCLGAVTLGSALALRARRAADSETLALPSVPGGQAQRAPRL